MNDLHKVQSKAMEDQKKILDALLAFDCQKQCVVAPAGLTKKEVMAWVGSVYLGLPTNCYNCVVEAIMKMWGPDELAKAKAKAKHDQTKIVRGILAFDCAHCDVVKLNAGDVQKWLNSVLVGAKKDCTKCLVAAAVKNWSLGDFNKVKGMSKKSQRQVVQAMLALNCVKECVEVPSGLDAHEVHMWLNHLLAGAMPDCYKCLADNIMKLWTKDSFKKVQAKSKGDQVKIVQGLVAFHCKGDCMPPAPLTPGEVSAWLKKMLPQASAKCLNCAVEHALKLWDSKVFAGVKAKSPKEQKALAQGMAVLNCPHACGDLDCPDCKPAPKSAKSYMAGSPLAVV